MLPGQVTPSNPLRTFMKSRFQFRLACLLLLVGMLCATFATAAPTRRLNILHLHADDHRADGLNALGNRILQTPNLDTLVARGMTLTRCYTMGSMVGAVCRPSRTMMLTGKSWLRIPNAGKKDGDASRSLPKVLSGAGYETLHVGKGGNDYTAGLAAFDTSVTFKTSTTDERRGASERHADAAIEFLRNRRAGAKPFYIYFSPSVPHDPRVAAPEFHRLYDPAKIPLPDAFLPQHPWDNGEMIVRDEQLAPWPRTPEDTKRQLADYYACITGLDYHIGRIFAQLKAAGEWDNTLIVFTGDNGLSLGEHGLFGKQNLYEFGGMHVPCVMAGPGISHGRSDAFVYLMDLYPTFCDFGGATVPAGVEGQSLVPVIQGRARGVRDVLYTAYRDSQRAVRDERWKLIRYPLVDRTQLFDLRADPHEVVNLAETPGQAAKVRAMMAVLEREMARYGDSAPLTVTNPKPAEWTPPAPSASPAAGPAKPK